MLTDMRRIAGLAWPVLIGQLAIIGFGVIDTMMVGRYAAVDLAALGLGASICVSVYLGLTGVVLALCYWRVVSARHTSKTLPLAST